MIDIRITDKDINTAECILQTISPSSGGMNIFIGTVRSHTKGKKVLRLEYECYEKMALKEMHRIADNIATDFIADNVLIHHRVGKLEVGEIVVLIIVAC